MEQNWRVRVLVAEDDEDLQKIMRINLEHEGFEVFQAENGKEALKLLNQNPPDIVLLDLMMPEMDGFEACKRIKSMDSTQDIPIIIVSAKEQVKDKLKCFSFQADDYVTKPYEYSELIARIYLHLNKTTVQQELRTRARDRAVRDVLEELSIRIRSDEKNLERDVVAMIDSLPAKHKKQMESIARSASAIAKAVEESREKNDPLYESELLHPETVEAAKD